MKVCHYLALSLTHHLQKKRGGERTNACAMCSKRDRGRDQLGMDSELSSTMLGKEGEQEGCSLHLLPCKIECTCDASKESLCTHPAKVDVYLEPVIKRKVENRSTVYSASFRGRPLQGVSVKIPEGFTGQILFKEQNQDALFSSEKV